MLLKNLETISKLLVLVLQLFITGNQVFCFSVDYPSFPKSVEVDFIEAPESYIVYDALQVTRDTNGASITNLSGKMVYKKRFKLWNKRKIASFNSTFVLNITPQPDGGGEGLAFILCRDSAVPANSQGQWLGIVNASTNGSSESNIVAVEFDTKKSYPEDHDSNHVGLDINSMYSNVQFSLNSSDIIIGNGKEYDVTGMIIYDGPTKTLNVSVFKGNQTRFDTGMPIISRTIDLSQYLPREVYVGFSASTGTGSQLNCVKAWFFDGEEISLGTQLWVWITVSVLSAAVLISSFAGGYLHWRKKYRRSHPSCCEENTIQGIEAGLGPKKIKLKDLKSATGSFNAKNELGRGGFGIVYKGTLKGTQVAVKRITNTSQGKQNLIAEVTTIGSVHHKNLVKLIGWCHEYNELILVYEYMPHRSLDYYIHTNDEKQHKNKLIELSWERRHNIICGVAQAIDYLHNECSKRVLHRDIKASNIMLDSEFNACLGDFGLARMFNLSEKTHHSTKEIAGTPGYMAPEIFHTGRATSETDVYAFGVLALVVACGKKPGFETKGSEYRNCIVDWVWELYGLDIVVDATDRKLKSRFDKVQAECMLVLGLACCHPNPHMRPSMRNALQVLMGEALPPIVPCEKPAFIWPATSPSFTREDSMSGGMLTPLSSLSGR